MKPSIFIFVVFAGIAAIAVGWIYQSKIEPTISTRDLEIPLDIDYYLSDFNYRVMSKTGSLEYDLSSPYLEHYKVEDLSRIEAPLMNIYREQQWHVRARTGELLHRSDILNLKDDVVFERKGDNPLKMETALMIFDINGDTVTGRNGVKVTSGKSIIDANSAVFDLERNIYSLNETAAVYYQ